MSGLMAQLPALQVVVPLLGALVAALINHRAFNYWLALAASWASLAIAAGLTLQVLDGGTISYAIGGWEPPWGIEYRVDELSAFVLMLVSAVGAAAMPFARRSVAQEIEEHRQGWFYSVYLLCLAGLLGIAITGDAFNSFVFLEISSLAMYTLIALGKDRRAPVAAFQYLIMGTIGATLYVAGIGFMYLATGTLNFADLSTRIEPAMADYSRTIVTALAFLTVGVSLKLALVPLHMWLPNAYAYAPSFVTVFIAATSTKVALYLLIRLFFSVVGLELAFSALPLTDVLVVLSVVAMFAASVVAVFQTDIKRMLAYSSLAQVGYITLGIALANHSGLTGSIVHLFNHALMKAALFMVLGAVFYRTASVQLDDLGGLWRKMPLTTAAFVVAGLGLIGTPGTAGFISKWYLGVGALEVPGGWILVFLIVASSLISVVYIGRVVEAALFRPVAPALENATDPPATMMVPLLVLAAAVIWFGIDTRLNAGIASRAAAMLLGGPGS